MKNKIFLILLLIPFIFFSQTDANLKPKTISGFVFIDTEPITGINVQVDNSMSATKTDSKGFFKIDAKAGEVLNFKFYGLKTVSILIEDITTVLNINLMDVNDIYRLNKNKVLKLGGSSIGVESSDFKSIKIDGKKLNKNAASFTEALLEKVPIFSIKQNNFNEQILYLKGKELNGPVLWNIDGVLYDVPIPISISKVKNVFIRYYDVNDCVINVNTTINYSKLKDIDFNNYYFTDEDYYNWDAVLYEKIKTGTPKYIAFYKNISKSKEALNTYIEQYSAYKNLTNYHLNVFKYFQDKYRTKDLLLKILSDYEIFSVSNPEDLKAIAYKYQELNEDEKAVAIYKKIIKIRPKHLQSYRDLANAYFALKDGKNANEAYNYMLKENFKIADNDIGEIIFSELAAHYNKDTTNFKQKIKGIDSTRNTNKDVRIVFEWNTTEAEFIIEFVNPDLELYHIENSLAINENLIIDQKKKGYTSKEVFIEKMNRGNWLVNFTYLGNKKYKPTVLKVTSYYNWGRPNQSKKVNTYDFNLKNVKTQLLKLNRRAL
jgi:tetratricopeptide (TPR) repeat protein